MYIGTTVDLIVNHDLFQCVFYVLYNYKKYAQPPGYSLSVDRIISDKWGLNKEPTVVAR